MNAALLACAVVALLGGFATAVAGPATHFNVSAPSTATAGTAFNITVTALDASNAIATGYTGTVHFTSSDGSSVLPANTTLTNGAGTFSVTLRTAGNQTVTATDTVTSSITGTAFNIVVSAAAATHFSVSAPPAKTAGTAFTFTVTALDQFNNTATTYVGTVHFSSSDGAATLPANSTLPGGAGTFSATLKTAGNQTVTATDTANTTITGTSGSITVSAAAATHFAVSAPVSATAGTAFNFTVTALDQFNNTATAYTGTVHFSSSDGAATLPANSTLTGGAGTFSATLKTAGNQTVAATDTANTTITGTSGSITVSAAAATHFAVAAPASATAAGIAFNFTVTALDQFNNTTTAYTGTVHFTDNGGLAVLPANSTLTNGVGTFSATLDSAADNQTITATDSANSAITGTSGDIKVLPAAATHFAVSAPSAATVGIAFNFTVTALDQFNDTATGYLGTVHFVSSDGSAVLPANYTFTGGDAGMHTFSATLNTAGGRTITATDTANSAITGTSGTVTVSANSGVPAVSSVSPNGGPPAGGTSVTIKGINLTGATAVKFGAVAAAGFVVSNSTTIMATSPAGAVGTVDVTVTTSQGTSATGATDKFTYAVPKAVQLGTKLVGTGNAGESSQGASIALSADGNILAVGAPQDNTNIGATWVFARGGTTWTQAPKLVGSGNVGMANQGHAVALSADGSTLIVGGFTDNGNIGAVWVFTRSGTTWTQQGLKLTPTDASGNSNFGASVALSSDGNTALIGGAGDNGDVGAAWVFTRNSSTWTQQGTKLVGTGEIGPGLFGAAVALSSDSNTALISGYNDNGGVGAAWVFTRSGSTWTQQGAKLTAGDESGPGQFGFAAALSSDGNTALAGGYNDNGGAGAAWAFTRSGSTWTQQGAKLVGTGAAGPGGALQGYSVALSSNGNAAAVGGPTDNNNVGATWLFARHTGIWSQNGAKLAGSGNVGISFQGDAVALSSGGNTLAEGGAQDNTNTGAAWIFTVGNLADTHDFNADSRSDILWRDTAGDATQWFMAAGGGVQGGESLGNIPTAWSVVGTRDFNGDGTADILWRDTSGDTTIWFISNGGVTASTSLGNIPTAWSVAGTGDFDGDGTGDILWHDTGGDTTIWLMGNGSIKSTVSLGTIPTIWSIAGTGDFNGDGTTDILWHDIYGDVTIWMMSGGSVIAQGVSLGNLPTNWSIVGTGDFDGDGITDILWRNTAGDVLIWLMSSNGTLKQQEVTGNVPTQWSVTETGDFNGDGKSDIAWIDTSGNVMTWLMNGFTPAAINLGNVGTPWSIQGANAD